MTAACLALMAPAASAAGTGVVPISFAEGSFAGLRAAPPARFEDIGSTIADVGDVNGDGVSDVAVGAARSTRPAAATRGSSTSCSVARRSAGSTWARPRGSGSSGRARGPRRPLPVVRVRTVRRRARWRARPSPGRATSTRDGLADILVGAPFAGRRGRAFSGSAYVVFGKRSTSAGRPAASRVAAASASTGRAATPPRRPRSRARATSTATGAPTWW